MKKGILSFFVGLLAVTLAFGQLSTRENDNQTFKLDARPQSGDMALTFALPLSTGSTADLSIMNTLTSGDFISMKYYIQSDIAIRGAVKLYKESDKYSGDLIDLANNGDALGSTKNKTSSMGFFLVPGIEKHFSKSNIFDVYAGGDLFLGIERDIINSENSDVSGDYNNYKQTSSNAALGLGGVIGMNVFIAQLPISLGIEYGLNFKYSTEGKTHVVTESSVGGTSNSQDYYTSTKVAGEFSKLSTSSVGINTNENVRIILTFYFSR